MLRLSHHEIEGNPGRLPTWQSATLRIMPNQTRSINGHSVPRFMYGTAWKEDETQRLVALAIQQGFRAIDTANQRRHYHEAGVGLAVAEAIAKGLVVRDDLFLQTKFTFQASQDHRLPYDPKASITEQVPMSFASSLEHLGVETIDSYLLHGPSQRLGLSSMDWEAWRAMETIHDGGRVRFLGVSNVTREQLDRLCQSARVRPTFVQNRCYAERGWDREVRELCMANQIAYQGFSLLTANRSTLADPEMKRIAKRHQRTMNQIVFRFALDVQMMLLTGTTDAKHMQEDLDVFGFHLEPEEIQQIDLLHRHRPA